MSKSCNTCKYGNTNRIKYVYCSYYNRIVHVHKINYCHLWQQKNFRKRNGVLN